jgi:hypothetical protein
MGIDPKYHPCNGVLLPDSRFLVKGKNPLKAADLKRIDQAFPNAVDHKKLTVAEYYNPLYRRVRDVANYIETTPIFQFDRPLKPNETVGQRLAEVKFSRSALMCAALQAVGVELLFGAELPDGFDRWDPLPRSNDHFHHLPKFSSAI